MEIGMEIIRDWPCRYMFGGKEQTVPLSFQWTELKYEDADDILVIEQNLPLDKVNYCYWFAMISCNHPTDIPFRYYGLWGHKDRRESLRICESAESELVTDGKTTKYGMCRFEKSNLNYAITSLLKGTLGYGSCIVLTSNKISLDAFYRFIMVEKNHPWYEDRVCLDYDKLVECTLSIGAVLLKSNEGSGGKILMVVYDEAK